MAHKEYPVIPRFCGLTRYKFSSGDGELGASLRYLSQRYSMSDDVCKGILTDIGTEELGHLEMIGTIVHQLTKNATTTQIENSPMAAYYIDHGKGIYPSAANGTPWNAAVMQSKGDPIADLMEDLAADVACDLNYIF